MLLAPSTGYLWILTPGPYRCQLFFFYCSCSCAFRSNLIQSKLNFYVSNSVSFCFNDPHTHFHRLWFQRFGMTPTCKESQEKQRPKPIWTYFHTGPSQPPDVSHNWPRRACSRELCLQDLGVVFACGLLSAFRWTDTRRCAWLLPCTT